MTEMTYEERVKLGEQTLSITSAQLRQYQLEKKMITECEACGALDWESPEENAMPSLTATTAVRSPGAGNWFFSMICNNCGHTRLINAGTVWQYFFRKEPGNG
ncbi:hypothetical protein [Pseudomonas knackmussii]|uniref:hypothetical protein n=1 Tax=Pseudomonas knackmussii TaxID=65741 RepID=UPI001363451E|nr:hypothetical protein [Pseudomonas knackmussii]